MLQTIDWCIIGGFFLLWLAIGAAMARRAGRNASEYFLSGREMPWWLLGVSMVATTFSTDTPNVVANFVREDGVAGNWIWWSMLLTGMLTVFVYAKLWRRSGVLTDLEFYELRYSGRTAAFLRGFRALYLGVFFNVIIMSTVTLAAIKIAGVLLGFSPLTTITVAAVVTVIYSSLGGLRGVLITDFLQFGVAMFGAIMAAKVALGLPEVGGLAGLIANDAVRERMSILPDFSNRDLTVSVFIVPFAVQWWASWYPGAEPGGGGYIAQRMLSAKNERHAIGATFFFNVAHYALRPWPWILVALCSLIVFPDLDSLRAAFPQVADKVGHDMAYPAMLSFLPSGLLGLVIASLIAAYMSTISTHLNWGSSYVVNDFYVRFMRPQASDREQVMVGRLCTVLMMVLASGMALIFENARQTFMLMLQIGAGTGLLFILRWFWWRINAAAEIAAMVVSFLAVIYSTFFHTRFGFEPMAEWEKIVFGVVASTVGWIVVMLFTRPTDPARLRSFYRLVRPGGPGWRRVLAEAQAQGDPIQEDGTQGWDVPRGIVCMLLGCSAVYCALFATGQWIYGQTLPACLCTAGSLVSFGLLLGAWGKLNIQQGDA